MQNFEGLSTFDAGGETVDVDTIAALQSLEHEAMDMTLTLDGNLMQRYDLSREFLQKSYNICQSLGIQDHNGFINLMGFESGGFKTGRHDNNAVGLISFTAGGLDIVNNLRKLSKQKKITLQEVISMNRRQQLCFVQEYLGAWFTSKNVKKPTIADVAASIFCPRCIGGGLSCVSYNKANHSDQYTSNFALDANGDGIITIGEYIDKVKKNGWTHAFIISPK